MTQKKNSLKKDNLVDKEKRPSLDEISSFCKRRGFVFPSSEIYDGLSAIYDYGPYGVELLENIKREWRKAMTQVRSDIVGLDSAIFMNPKVWEASGHLKSFSDPLIECHKCMSRFRLDTILEEIGEKADEKMSEEQINKLFDKHRDTISCSNCGAKDFSSAKNFNLLVQSNLGSFSEKWTENPSYLRGETCQGIYINFKNILDSSRQKIPFGIAQIGKAFRNEITARQFIFRTREFEQMEMQYFVDPEESEKYYNYWKEERWNFYLSLGIKEENLRWAKHDNLVFYAKEAYDIEYKFPFGFKEIEGIHNRSDYDLRVHSEASKQDLSYFDPVKSEKYFPYVIETSAGLGRIFLALMSEFYREEKIGDDSRMLFSVPAKLAPVKVAVFPLLKNKEDLLNKAKEIFDFLKLDWKCEFDSNGNIGKRYRRQDEIGTPFCVTVDFDSLENNDVTIRERDSMRQFRIKIDELRKFFFDNL